MRFVFFTVATVHAIMSGSPCHQNNDQNRPALDCEAIVLPKGLCNACGVDVPLNATSLEYAKCRFVTNLQPFAQEPNAACVERLEAYVNLNACDQRRREDVACFQNDTQVSCLGLPMRRFRARLDYFLYSVCEQACDCLPQIDASVVTKQVDVYRGNCQAHTLFDTCRVLPNIKSIRGEDDASVDVSVLPKTCPAIQLWWEQEGDDFLHKPHVNVSTPVVSFLEQFVAATDLLQPNTLWSQCLYLESTLQRITVAPQITSEPNDDDDSCQGRSLLHHCK